MHLNVSSKFSELSARELNEVDGGEWYDYVLGTIIPGYTAVKWLADDLQKTYEVTYAETVASLQAGN